MTSAFVPRLRLVALMAITAAFGLPTSAKYNNGFDADASEALKLPKFCQGQYIPALRNKPGYTIQGCGTFTNHICPSLVLLNRAEDFTLSRVQRKEALIQAGDNLAYTRNHVPPTCWVMPYVNAAEARYKLLKITLK